MTRKGLFAAKRRRSIRVAATAASVVLIGTLAACQTHQQRVTQHEDNLAAAGFIIQPANTPERKSMLSRLPPNHFVKRQKNDITHYVYADPLVCGCLYVGSQQAYGRYRLHQQEQHLADEQQMTAETYSDAAWTWSSWGPWGPGYGFVYGDGYGW